MADSIQASIEREVAKAPPLSAYQRDRLRMLLTAEPVADANAADDFAALKTVLGKR